MPVITHFKSPEGEKLQIAAAELVTVEVPAAGSADLGDWSQGEGSAYYMENTFTDAPAASAVLQSCTDPSAITDHGLRIEFDEQLQDWVLRVDSLPETACTLTLLFINHATEDTPCVLPALGIGGGTGETSSPAATQYAVKIPAAGSEDLGAWWTSNDLYMARVTLEGITEEEMAVHVSCPDASIFTEHGLYVTQDTGTVCSIELELTSLPATATVLYLLVQHAEGGGAVYMPVISQSGSAGVDAEARAAIESMQTELESLAQADDDLSTEVQTLDIAVKDLQQNGAKAATYYTVRIPAAGSAELHGWHAMGDIYELQIMDVAWMKADLFLELKSENAALFTEHNLRLYQDDGFLDFAIDSLPEKESVLYIVVPNVVNGGELNGGES